MTPQMKASCGCGWISIPAGQSELNTVQQAMEHCEHTGHAVEIRGQVRPTPARIRQRLAHDYQLRAARQYAAKVGPR